MISVIITTCKREQYILDRAICSVLDQSYRDWELIVVDDSPEEWDDRERITAYMESWQQRDNRIHYIKNTVNLGACASRNIGLNNAKGEYVAYLDDDDEWKREKLEKQLHKFEQAPDKVALVYCGSEYYDDCTNRIINNRTVYKKGDVFDELIVHNFIGGASFPLIRTDALLSINGFDNTIQAGQDVDVWLRLVQKYQIDYVEENLVIYHIHKGEQISTSPRKKIKGLEQKIAKNQKYFQTHKRQYNICLTDLAIAYAMNKEYKKCIFAWINAVKQCPLSITNNIKGIARIYKWGKKQRNV